MILDDEQLLILVANFFLLTRNLMPTYIQDILKNMPWLETFHCLNFGCNIKVLLAKSISLST